MSTNNGFFSNIKEAIFIEIIEHIEPSADSLMWKFPDNDCEIKNGAKLTVRPNQTVLFINEGQIADTFGEGLHTLSTQNIPIISRLRGWKYGFESPFKADVFFFNTKQFVNLRWGTPAPIIMRDPQFGQVRLRAFGSYNIRINDPAKFYKEYAGNNDNFTTKSLETALRDFIAPHFGEELARCGISVLDAAQNVTMLGEQILPAIKPYFDDFGLELVRFVVTSITLPEELTEYLDKATGMNMVGDLNKYQQFNVANAVSQQGSIANEGTTQGMMMGMMLNTMQQQTTQPTTTQQQTAQITPTTQPQPNTTENNSKDDIFATLKELAALAQAGILTPEEFAAKKAELLAKL